MKDLKEQALEITEKIIEWRRSFHRIPELDLNLPKTSEMVQRVLKEMGIPFRTFKDHSGIEAHIRGRMIDEKSKTVALRADMDGLRIKEKAEVPYASDTGNMHACGHDAHMAMVLGAARLLLDNIEELEGNVKLIFQPGEERSGGAERMLKEGVFENPRVDLVLGQHVGLLVPELPNGHFGFYPGNFMASRDSFRITVEGKGGHGSTPASSVDPIVIASHLILALQTLVSREVDGTDSVVITIGSIHGGETYNVIPETVELIGAIRCLKEEQRDYFSQRIRNLCQGICESMRGSCSIDYERGYPVTFNHFAETEFVMKQAIQLFGEERVHLLEQPLMGSEDISFFLQKAPGCYWIFATQPLGSKIYPNHNPRFELDDSLLYMGSALMAQTTLSWLRSSKSR